MRPAIGCCCHVLRSPYFDWIKLWFYYIGFRKKLLILWLVFNNWCEWQAIHLHRAQVFKQEWAHLALLLIFFYVQLACVKNDSEVAQVTSTWLKHVLFLYFLAKVSFNAAKAPYHSCSLSLTHLLFDIILRKYSAVFLFLKFHPNIDRFLLFLTSSDQINLLFFLAFIL